MAELSVAENNEDRGINIQIFHELGKLSEAQQSVLREMGGIRLDVKERADGIIRELDSHKREDDLRFKPLEDTRSKAFGIIAAVSVFWIMITTGLLVWFKYGG